MSGTITSTPSPQARVDTSELDHMLLNERTSTGTQDKAVFDSAAIANLIDLLRSSAPKPQPTPTPTPEPAPPAPPAPPALKLDGNTVDTGRYTISASKDEAGTVNIYDKTTNTWAKAFGDPHLLTSDGDRAGFQREALVIHLKDNTDVTIDPTALNGGVATIADVHVARGDQDIAFSNFLGADPIKVANGPRYTPPALGTLQISLGDDGRLDRLFVADQTKGGEKVELASKEQEQDLDRIALPLLYTNNDNGSDNGM